MCVIATPGGARTSLTRGYCYYSLTGKMKQVTTVVFHSPKKKTCQHRNLPDSVDNYNLKGSRLQIVGSRNEINIGK
jgi:hypothetical protein